MGWNEITRRGAMDATSPLVQVLRAAEVKALYS